MRNKLIKAIDVALDKHTVDIKSYAVPVQEWIADYLLADGWIKPPYRPGDAVWYLDYDLPRCFMTPEKLFVQDIVLTTKDMLIRCSEGHTFRKEDFGNIVFASCEAACAALEEVTTDEQKA